MVFSCYYETRNSNSANIQVVIEEREIYAGKITEMNHK